jgi:hypothetical protein
MATIGLIAEQLMGEASIPIGDYDIYRTYMYGQSLANPKLLFTLPLDPPSSMIVVV